MRVPATRSILFAILVVALSGCASWRQSVLNWRLGLEPAAAQQPVDPQLGPQIDTLYAQGAVALAANDLDAAIAAWRQYARLAPPSVAQARKVRGYLTLLQRESARRFARQAAAREKAAPYAPTDRLHVALFPLHNRGPDPGQPPKASFNRAVMAMITTDLAQVPSLTVLEREKVDYLLRELALAGSGLVDAQTLRAEGRLLGAGTVVAGSVYNQAGTAGPGSGRYRIDTAVSDVAGGGVIGVQDADGAQADFYMLEKRIVYGILECLEVKEIPASVNRIHTRSWAAYAQFAAGLKLLDEDRFDEARQAFRAALKFDPGFDLAAQAFLDTPAREATLEEIKADSRPGS